MTCLAIAFGIGYAGAQTMTNAEIDSLSRAAATIMADQINKSVASLEGTGVAVNDSVFNATLLQGLQGKDTGFNTMRASEYINGMVQRMHAEYVNQQKEFLGKMAATANVNKLSSGVLIITEKEGAGPKPTREQSVKINYVGRLSNGTEFDSTKGEPIVLKVSDLVPGFTEGLLNMQAGGKYRLIIPADQAYGSREVGGVIPADSALDFSIEIDSIQ